MTSTPLGSGARCESGACIVVDVYTGDGKRPHVVRIRSTQTGTVMQATWDEWIAFIAAVKNGDHDVLPRNTAADQGESTEATAQ